MGIIKPYASAYAPASSLTFAHVETNATMRQRGIAKALIHELMDYTLRHDMHLGLTSYTPDGRNFLARKFTGMAQLHPDRIGFYQTC